MKIGIDARMMGKQQATGIGAYIHELVRHIIPHDTEHEYVVFVKPENKHLMDPYLTLPHLTVVITPCHWYSVCEQLYFCAQLYAHRLDIVHFPQFNVPLAYRKPFVVTIHDVTPLRFPGHTMRSRLRRWAFILVFRNALKHAHKILTVSHYSQEQIRTLFPKITTPIIITPLGVDNGFRDRVNYDKIKAVRKRFALTKPYLLYLGVLRNHKNIHGLVRAFAEVRQAHDITLVLAGMRAPHYPELDQALAELPQAVRADIVMPGFIPDEDVPALYQGAVAYVVPSFEEGFGLNGLEAMISGIPVVAARAGSLPEVYGSAAAYANPADTLSLANTIKRVLNDAEYARTLVALGYEQLKRYSWDITARATRSVYTDTLSNLM